MNRKVKFAPESYFHIYNRGVEKRKIFLEYKDYQRFLALLYLCNNNAPVDIRGLFNKGLTFAEVFDIERENILVNIGAYCLMPNHIHLLVKPKNENGVALFMQKLFTGYTMYFNKKNQRTGRLFESTFKANLADTDGYLKYLFAYIHLNPIKLIEPEWKEKGINDFEKVKEFLNSYQWSSHGYYTGQREKEPVINHKEFPEYFENNKEFKDFTDDWLKYQSFSFTKV